MWWIVYYLNKEKLPDLYLSFCVLQPHMLCEFLKLSKKILIAVELEENISWTLDLKLSPVKTKAASTGDAIHSIFQFYMLNNDSCC